VRISQWRFKQRLGDDDEIPEDFARRVASSARCTRDDPARAAPATRASCDGRTRVRSLGSLEGHVMQAGAMSRMRRTSEPRCPVPVVEFRFRYMSRRRRAMCYDVTLSLGRAGELCRVEIRHADVGYDDGLPFPSGKLSALRLRRGVELLELVDRVVTRDRSCATSGTLIYSARLKAPAAIQLAAPHTGIAEPRVANGSHPYAYGARRNGHPKSSLWPSRAAQMRARKRIRYPSKPL
jgi:hypothetical protein